MGFSESTIAAEEAGFGDLRHVSLTGSTNADLADESRRGVVDPAVLVADHQSAGRGRLDREWVDTGKALLVSLRMPASSATAHPMMQAVAAAARQALSGHITEDVLFKWPNDLVVVRHGVACKIAGVLAEWIDSKPPVVVVGVGINIGPVHIDQPTTSVEEAGGVISRDRLLAEMLAGVPARLADRELVRAEFLSNNATLGHHVRAHLPGGSTLVGLATGLTNDGHLLLTDGSGIDHVVSAGDVIHLRLDGSD